MRATAPATTVCPSLFPWRTRYCLAGFAHTKAQASGSNRFWSVAHGVEHHRRDAQTLVSLVGDAYLRKCLLTRHGQFGHTIEELPLFSTQCLVRPAHTSP